jgi:cytidylate kinase
MRITVTLTRQFGCGGSYLGQHLADNLGARCLDREIVSRAAQQLALEESELAQREERGTPFWQRMLRGITAGPPEALYHAPVVLSFSDKQLLEAETEVMKEIAAQEDCVIVGRLAAYVLPSHPGMMNIYLHAPLSFRIPRVREYYGATDAAQARAMIAQADETRERYMRQMIGREEDDAKNYHLCLDTSVLPLPELSDLLTAFIKSKTNGYKETNGAKENP